jgi:NAD(P)-dependent dehydrogenase (short-subunit alcohol dehydrogenase family)
VNSNSLSGRSAIVTGASEGLGAEIARHYAKAGANVLVCARSESTLDGVTEELRALGSADQKISSLTADVSKPTDCDRVVHSAIEEFGELHILVNNAGVYGPKGALEDVDWAEWTKSIEINLYGSVLMCRAVLPHFKQQKYGKIVQLSGGGATNPLPRISGYAASKAAIVRLAETLAEEVREYRIDVNSIAPGALNTRLLDEVLQAGPDKVGAQFYEKSVKQKEEGGSALNKGAELAVYLGSAASDGITGKLLSAIWDPWSTLQEHADELRKSDIYTLRRIVPKDRGSKWGD